MKCKYKLQLAAFFMSILMLAACKPNQIMATITPKEAGLTGQWSMKCEQSKTVYGYHYKKVFTFEKNSLQTTLGYYKDTTKGGETCRSQALGFLATFNSYIVLGKTTSPGTRDEHTDMNINTTRVRLAPMDDEHLADFNRPGWNAGVYSGFGQTDWKKNDLKNISNVPAAIIEFHIGTSLPDIFQISRDPNDLRILKMGDKLGNLDQDGRPLMLEKIYATFDNF
jgi:hypothetical protein